MVYEISVDKEIVIFEGEAVKIEIDDEEMTEYLRVFLDGELVAVFRNWDFYFRGDDGRVSLAKEVKGRWRKSMVF